MPQRQRTWRPARPAHRGQICGRRLRAAGGRTPDLGCRGSRAGGTRAPSVLAGSAQGRRLRQCGHADSLARPAGS
ncbi:hypothetical protein LEMLEM_LOCUS14503 [Lemmus lemmus]